MKYTSFLFATGLLLSACSGNAQKNEQLMATAFRDGILQAGIQLLDVRSAEEYRSGHITNCLQADWNNQAQFRDRVQHLDKNKPVYVYCLAGARSASAAKWMRNEGFSSVYELSGGINAWKKAGLPLEGASGDAQMTLDAYEQLVRSHPVVLVDFGAIWCPPCKKMEPVLESLQKEEGNRYMLVKVDGGKDLEVMKAQSVEALPVFIVYKNGKETWRHQGIIDKETLRKQL
jgi:rhodanese-related sulfurtransferase